AITFRADAGDGRFFEQKYTIKPNSYAIDYDVDLSKLGNAVAANAENIELQWVNYLDRLERNSSYERNYSSVYYKAVDDDPTYCSCTSDDKEVIDDERVKWVSHSNQFFNTTLMAKGGESFTAATVATEMMDDKAADLKKLSSKVQIPYNGAGGQPFAMQLYVGPNEFDRLQQFDNSLEDIIPFGSSIFGTVNRWLIRPLFNLLSSFIGSAGLVILMLTVIVKLALYPFTYKMLYSQSKMAALKPQITKMGEKFKDNPQEKQMETMKMYQQYGVNPLGGCLPMVAQMPIWFALYRFFPASIEFRQADFLWATDLSSYDVFAYLPFEIPFYGSHVSLFTILWALTTVIYTYYNSRHMDMSAQPAMKYMQYFMPIMFLFFFNNFAAGLTCYLFFSNLFNIAQTLITKEVIIDKDKIAKELEMAKAKPKKKGGFRERLEKAMAEQQRIAAEQAAKRKK
ncbi:MAG: membrane protein insertase YidC, partial [Bacteroidota bacterium]